MGLGAATSTLYLIDFGLAAPYQDHATSAHLPNYTARNTLLGTLQFALLNSHMGYRLSRRDDVKSATYVLLHLAAGTLSRADYCQSSADEYCMLEKCKRTVDIASFCQSLDIPPEFTAAILYARGLAYTEAPDYLRLRNLYRRISQAESAEPSSTTGLRCQNSSPAVRASPWLAAFARYGMCLYMQ